MEKKAEAWCQTAVRKGGLSLQLGFGSKCSDLGFCFDFLFSFLSVEGTMGNQMSVPLKTDVQEEEPETDTYKVTISVTGT